MRKYIAFIGLIITSSFAVTDADKSQAKAAAEFRNNQNNISYSSDPAQKITDKNYSTPKTSSLLIFNSNTIILLLLLIVLTYFAYISTIRRNFRFKKEVSKESIREYFEDMAKYFSKIDSEIIKERKNSYQNLQNEVRDFIAELKDIAKQNKETTSTETRKLEELVRCIEDKFNAKITSANQEISDSANQVTNKLDVANNQLSNSLETIDGIHKYIIEDARNKDEKIREHESSYNTKIVTKLFADSLIETLDYIDYELQKEENKNNKVLLEIQDDLLTVLSANNIKRLELEENMLFDYEARKKFLRVKISLVETTEESLQNRVVNIKTHGYYKPDIKLDSGKQIVRPAQISVYDFKPDDTKEDKNLNEPQQVNTETDIENHPIPSQDDEDNHIEQENKNE